MGRQFGERALARRICELGVKIALYPTLTATSGLQGAWELLSAFHERGPVALTDYAKRVNANAYGRVDFRKLNATDRVRELEQYLPETQKRDYETTWGHEPFSEKK